MQIGRRRQKVDPRVVVPGLDHCRANALGDGAREVAFVAIGARRREVDRRKVRARRRQRGGDDRTVEPARQFEKNIAAARTPSLHTIVYPQFECRGEFGSAARRRLCHMLPRQPDRPDRCPMPIECEAAAGQ